jgi:hypothetical protein
MIFTSRSARRTRNAMLALVMSATCASGIIATAGAAHASVVTDASCTAVSGTNTYTPALARKKVHSTNVTLAATISGCQDFGTPAPGTGSLNATLSGKASQAAENFSGTFVINWPTSAGLNPSVGTLAITESNGSEIVSGSVTSGALMGRTLNLAYVNTLNSGKGKKVSSQQFVNTQSLTLSRNGG